MQSKPDFCSYCLSQASFVQLGQERLLIETKISQEKNPFYVREVCCSSLVTCKVLDFFSQTRLCTASLQITSPSWTRNSSTLPHPALCPSTSSSGRDTSSGSFSNLIALAVEQSTGAWGKAASVALLWKRACLPGLRRDCLTTQLLSPRTGELRRGWWWESSLSPAQSKAGSQSAAGCSLHTSTAPRSSRLAL